MKKSNKIKTTKRCSNLISNIQPLISDHRGITLVALIITIIVMLILVGVSISIAINGGLFDITKRAVRETENAKSIEQQLANGRIKIGDTWYDSIEDYVNDKPSGNQGEGTVNTPPLDTSIYESAPKDETTGVLKANAIVTDRTTGITATVPKGFKLIDGIEGTKSIEDGLVIQDKDGNEFVWIPVEVTESDTEREIKSFYRSEWENDERSTSLKDSTEYVEPFEDGYTGEVDEYWAMVKSVYENKGFYIGRYEAGSVTERKADTANGTTEMVVKKSPFPYNYVGWGKSLTDYESEVVDKNSNNQGKGAVYLSKNMYKEKDVGVTSTLCYGVQWDAMVDFTKGKDNIIDSAKNIYDLTNGNEWTMEQYGVCRILRSDPYDENGSRRQVHTRYSILVGNCLPENGFRVAIYIK